MLGASVPVVPKEPEEEIVQTTIRVRESVLDTVDFFVDVVDDLSRNKLCDYFLKFAAQVHLAERQAELKGRDLKRELATYLEKKHRERERAKLQNK